MSSGAECTTLQVGGRTISGDRTNDPLRRSRIVGVGIRQIPSVVRGADDYVLDIAMSLDGGCGKGTEDECRDESEHGGQWRRLRCVRIPQYGEAFIQASRS